jgi:hypothetical protein
MGQVFVWIVFISIIALIGYLIYGIRKSSLLDKLEKQLDDPPSQTFKGMEEQLENLKHITPLSEQNKRLIEQNQSIIKLLEKFIDTLFESSEQNRKENAAHNQQLQKLLHELNQSQKESNQNIERLFQQVIGGDQNSNTKQGSYQEKIKTENVQRDEVFATVESDIQEKEKNVYYLPFPDNKGFFWNDKKSRDRQNGKSAQFTFLNDDEAILKMVRSNPGFLKSVCNFTENRTGRDYKVLKDGTLYYDNNKWIVDSNNKIDLEVI